MYPSFEDIQVRRAAARRHEAVHVLIEAAAMARAHRGRLVAFGSLAEGGFGEDSDLDIAIFGIEPDRDILVSARIDTFIRSKGFVPDIVEERFIPPSLLDRIRQHGQEPSSLE